MNSRAMLERFPGVLSMALVCAASLLVWGCGGDDEDTTSFDPSLAVQKATCGPNDKPEPDLQGQVSAAQRTAGYKGNNCNLELVGQSRGDGASWQYSFFTDKAGHQCGYHDTASFTANRTHLGTVVLDTTNPARPTPTAYLDSIAMIDPWESLKLNDRRQLLAGVNALNGNGGPEIDIYDVSGDCRFPQLLTSKSVGLDDGTGQFVAAVRGHEGNFAPDGLTYYAANLGAGYIYPIDVSNVTKPRMLTQYFTAPGRVHGMNASDDGNRLYVASLGNGGPNPANTTGVLTNGMIILDTSEIQARKADPQMKVVSVIVWPDGGGAQHVINTIINGRSYAIQVDEAGSGGNSSAGWAAACAANMPAWQFARIIDIQDETKPTIVSKLMLEAYDPKYCSKVLPDLNTQSLGSFTYGSHYCSVDNRKNATTLACGYFNSGISGVRHSRSDQAEGNRLLESARYHHGEPRVQPSSQRWLGSWRPRLVRLPDSSGRGERDPANHLPGQRLRVAEVHQRRVAVPDQHHTAGAAELTRSSRRFALKQQKRRRSFAGVSFGSPTPRRYGSAHNATALGP
jgi:hypothetical protein